MYPSVVIQQVEQAFLDFLKTAFTDPGPSMRLLIKSIFEKWVHNMCDLG